LYLCEMSRAPLIITTKIILVNLLVPLHGGLLSRIAIQRAVIRVGQVLAQLLTSVCVGAVRERLLLGQELRMRQRNTTELAVQHQWLCRMLASTIIVRFQCLVNESLLHVIVIVIIIIIIITSI